MAAAEGFGSHWLVEGDAGGEAQETTESESLIPGRARYSDAEVTLVKTGEVALTCDAERTGQDGWAGMLALVVPVAAVLLLL